MLQQLRDFRTSRTANKIGVGLFEQAMQNSLLETKPLPLPVVNGLPVRVDSLISNFLPLCHGSCGPVPRR